MMDTDFLFFSFLDIVYVGRGRNVVRVAAGAWPRTSRVRITLFNRCVIYARTAHNPVCHACVTKGVDGGSSFVNKE